ncbi:hypothetical protein H0H92_000344 [Tricholoma furcatifolium]|nr:hypothetical protein H0H92_000344 [Tricholoma furcatifolium]
MSSSSSSSSSSPEPPSAKQKTRKRKNDVAPAGNSDDADSDASSDVEATPEDPVLSHAERRKQKKAEKRKAKEAEEETSAPTKKRKLENGKSAPGAGGQRKNSVWVGNLAFKTTQEDLKEFFKEVGEVVRINMPTKPAGNPGMKPQNRGYAYVDFASPDAKTVAIALSEQPLLGRNDFTGRPAAPDAASTTAGAVTHSKTAQKILKLQKQPPAPTLFLGNLGFETTEQDIRQLLEAHRPRPKKKPEAGEDGEDAAEDTDDKKEKDKDVWLRKVRMGTFEDSGLCKGFAFIDFTTIEHATAALINPKNHQLNGRKLVVEYAGAEAVRRGAPKGQREPGSAPARKRVDSTHSKRTERPEHKARQDTRWTNDKVDREDAEENFMFAKEPRTRRDQEGAADAGQERRQKGPRSRPKPGAALALAKRESAAIVPSKGNKITF